MAKFRLTGYVQGCLLVAMLNIFSLTVSFGVWKLGVLLISALTGHKSTPPAQVLLEAISLMEMRPPICTARTKHWWSSTFPTLLNLPICTHTTGFAYEAGSSGQGFSISWRTSNQTGESNAQSGISPCCKSVVDISIMQGRNYSSASFPSPKDQEFPQLLLSGTAI